MSKLKFFLLLLPLCIAFNMFQEPEIRWIFSDTRKPVGTAGTSNDKKVEITVSIDTSISLSPVKAVIYYGPTPAEDLSVMGFEITYIRPETDTITQQVRGPFFPSNMMALMKSAHVGDYFHVSKIRIEGPSGTPVVLKRQYSFRMTY